MNTRKPVVKPPAAPLAPARRAERSNATTATPITVKSAVTTTATEAAEESGWAKTRASKVRGWYITQPELANAVVVAINTPKVLLCGDPCVDLGGVADALVAQAECLKLDDLTGVQAMLSGQAAALQSMFVMLASRAAGAPMEDAKTMLGLALRAQQQCERVLRTVVEMKQPRASSVFAKTAAVAVGGAQQVNVGGRAVSSSRESAPEANMPNELIEKESLHAMDAGGPRTGSRASTASEALAAIDRATHREG